MNSSSPILIYRLGSLGDTVVALPCFNKIMECFPDRERIAVTNIPVAGNAAPLEAILGQGRHIHRSIAYPIATRDMQQLMTLAKELRRTGARSLIYLGGSGRPLSAVWRDLLFFQLAGVRRVIGAPLLVPTRHGRIDRRTGLMEHEAVRLARSIRALGAIEMADRGAWDLHLTPDEIARAQVSLQPRGHRLIALNMGGKAASKDWREARWAALLTRLASEIESDLLFIGAAEDRARCDRLANLWPTRTVNGCGILSPREAAAALRHAVLFIGHDSGPMHLAAAMGVRCIALFGIGPPPGKWYPFGAGHQILHEPLGIDYISVDRVVDAVSAVWRDMAPSSG